MDRKWLYPYYVIAILVVVLYLFGCDSGRSSSFSVEVQVETDEGSPVEGATVSVRPCYDVGQEVWCGDGLPFRSAQARAGRKAVELVSWEARIDEKDVLLTWTTASETDNAGFSVEKNREAREEFRQILFVDGQGTTDESTSYTYRYVKDLPPGKHLFRLVAVATDGTSRIAGEPISIQGSPVEPEVGSIFPNPFRSQTTFRVQVGDSSSLRSTIHTLDGAQVRTITDEAFLDAGRYQYVWSADDLAAGVYEHRTQVRKEGKVVAGDTTYAAVTGTASLGTTGADGTVSTTDRTGFPAFYDVPPIGVKDAEGRVRDTMRVSPTMEFAVTTENGRQTFRRTVSEGENTLTLSVSP